MIYVTRNASIARRLISFWLRLAERGGPQRGNFGARTATGASSVRRPQRPDELRQGARRDDDPRRPGAQDGLQPAIRLLARVARADVPDPQAVLDPDGS